MAFSPHDLLPLLAAAFAAALALPGDGPAGGGVPPEQAERERMVDRQIARRGIRDPRVLAALRAVPRHLFVPERWRSEAYRDGALPIELGQTISQPYIVALMTELLQLRPGAKVLEIGTGSGYQAAVLAQAGARVFTIEILEPLGRSAAERLQRLGYPAQVRIGDGYRGWPEEAPFDGILLTAAPREVPQPLLDQLAPGGRLVAPVGGLDQQLLLYERTPHGLERHQVGAVAFVPMTGEAQGDGGR